MSFEEYNSKLMQLNRQDWSSRDDYVDAGGADKKTIKKQ